MLTQVSLIVSLVMMISNIQTHPTTLNILTGDPTPTTAVYPIGIGIISGPVRPIASARDGEATTTTYTTDPDRLSQVLIGAHYFQATGVASGTVSPYPWHFQRTDPRPESVAIVRYGYNAQRHTQLIAVGIATGALLASAKGGQSASGGSLPKALATTPMNTTITPAYCVGCGGTFSTSFTTDTAYFDPVWIKLNEGKLNLSCTENGSSVYNCSGWWYAWWQSDDGWQFTGWSYTGPFSVGNEMWNSGDLHFKHPWFCVGQTTYVDYTPNNVRIGPTGNVSNGSWSTKSGACTWLLTEVTYS